MSLRMRTPTDGRVAEALKLVDYYTPHDKRIGIFLSADDTTEVLMLSRKANIYPFNYALQENTLKPSMDRIFAFKPQFEVGDIIFVSRDYTDLQARLVHEIQQQFHLTIKETSPHYIFAMELNPL